MALPKDEFTHHLHDFLEEIQEIHKSPNAKSDPETLTKIATTIESLDQSAHALLNDPDESIKCDAKMVTNMLENPLVPDVTPDKSISATEAAKAYLKDKQPDSDLEHIIDSCVKSQDRIEQILEDINDILKDFHSS